MLSYWVFKVSPLGGGGGKCGLVETLVICLHRNISGPVARNHGNLYDKILALVSGRYGVPHARVNGTK